MKGYIKPSRQIAIALLITVSLVSCGGNKVREARKAAHRIQVITDAAVDTTSTLYHDGVIDRARTNQIAKILLKVNDGNRVLINKAELATVDTPGVRSGLLAQLKIVEDAVKELKDAGVLGIKSKSGELAFQSAITALDSSIAIIQVALAGGK